MKITPIVLLMGFVAAGGFAQGCVLDQSQVGTNYGFWFEAAVPRWQQFVPTLPALCSVEVYLQRQGSAGDVLLEVQDSGPTIVWQGTILQAAVATGWNAVAIAPVVPVNPGALYSLHLRTNQPSTSPQNRYFWRGQSVSNAYPQGISDVESGWPGYDYGFKTWGAAIIPPGTVNFQPGSTITPGGLVQVLFASPAHGGQIYIPYVSCTLGATPLAPGIVLPVMLDVCSDFYFTSPVATSIFALTPPGSYTGTLDAAGSAIGVVTMPSFFPSGLNLPIHIGFVTIGGGVLTSASQIGTLTLL